MKFEKKVDTNGNRAESVGIIDMGGGSTQIAFEVKDQGDIDGADFTQFNLGTSDTSPLEYKLFVTTHLGFGANVAMGKYHQMLVNEFDQGDQVIAGKKSNFGSGFFNFKKAIPDPCLPPGAKDTLDGFEFVGAGNYTQCYHSLRPLLHKVIYTLKRFEQVLFS